MKPTLLLDTHIWLWWLLGQPELAPKERDALDALAAAGTPPGLSAISLWEAQMLAAKGRLKIDTPLTHWLPTAVAVESVTLLPMDVADGCCRNSRARQATRRISWRSVRPYHRCHCACSWPAAGNARHQYPSFSGCQSLEGLRSAQCRNWTTKCCCLALGQRTNSRA